MSAPSPMRIVTAAAALLFACAHGYAQPGKVIVAPAPAGEPLSADYTVEVNGSAVPVYTARVNDPPLDHLDHGGTYSFISFDFSGNAVIRIHATRMLQGARVRPVAKGIRHSLIDSYTTTVTLDKPAKLSFEPGGRRRPLLIFANPPETDVPAKDGPGVVYFGPGIHKPEGGVIQLKSNQTLYLAAGAVVQAAVVVRDGENVTIRGRGILCGNSWPWRKGPAPRFMGLRASKNVKIEGIILRGSYGWTLVPESCENVNITNVKICGGRAWNDDGINPVNTRHMTVRDCFIRTDDDCTAAKGLQQEWGDVDDIRVENSLLWCDRARVFLLGHESRAKYMRNIVYRDLDIIHFVQPFVLEPGEDMTLENVLFEDLRIEGAGQGELVRIRPAINQYMRTKTPGHIRNIVFRNVAVTGDTGNYGISVEGYDEKHQALDVAFENVAINGRTVTREWPNLRVGKDATVRFGPAERPEK